MSCLAEKGVSDIDLMHRLWTLFLYELNFKARIFYFVFFVNILLCLASEKYTLLYIGVSYLLGFFGIYLSQGYEFLFIEGFACQKESKS